MPEHALRARRRSRLGPTMEDCPCYSAEPAFQGHAYGSSTRLWASQAWHGMTVKNLKGSCRFGEDVLETMLGWTDKLLLTQRKGARELSVLDLGTGNGIFALKMADLGYKNLTGCDYSPASIRLAVAIAKKAGVSSIRWIQDDLLETGIADRYLVLMSSKRRHACCVENMEVALSILLRVLIFGLSATSIRSKRARQYKHQALNKSTSCFLISSIASAENKPAETSIHPKTSCK